MNNPATTLAVFFEPDALEMVHPSWPNQVFLAVCLTADGDCNLLTFCEEELKLIPHRILSALGASQSELCVVPRIPGFASRALLYSEQQTLIDIIKGHPSVLEEAQDYAVNFQFALDEGLDPQNILDPATETVSTETLIDQVFADTSPSLPSFLRSRKEMGINAASGQQASPRRTIRANSRDNALVIGPDAPKLAAPTRTFTYEADLFVNASGQKLVLSDAEFTSTILSSSEDTTIAVQFPELPRDLLKHLRSEAFFAEFRERSGSTQIEVKDEVPATRRVVEFVSRRQRTKPSFPRWTLMAG